MKRSVYLRLTPLEEAKEIWFAKVGGHALPHEAVPLHTAHKRILAVPAVACVSSPAFHGAAMDGIAVDAKKTFGTSESRPKTLTPEKDAFWINTGKPLPIGTDAVIMVENVQQQPDGLLVIESAAFPWQHVRKLGEDMVATEILLPAGVTLGAYELGALAAAGVFSPLVYKKPVVAIIPTGSELVPLDMATPENLSEGNMLPEFNSLVLKALLEDVGADVFVLPITPDEPEAIKTALLDASAKFDLVIINAGSSAGSHDYTAPIINELGEVWVHGVTIMPGKPTVLGKIEETPVIGIPGYPVSAAIACEQFAVSLITCWFGKREPIRPEVQAIPYRAIPSRSGMEEFIRVKLGRVKETMIAVPLPRGAGTVTSLSRADGILRIPSQSEGISAGRYVPVSLLRSPDQIEGALLAIGSHDTLLELLDSMLRKHTAEYSLTSAHVGSLGGLHALRDQYCHLAGCHLLDPDTGVYNKRAVTEHLPHEPVMLVRLVDREQGLIVPLGNPLNLCGIEDLIREDVTFINRQRGSGTRVLLDYKLQALGISSQNIKGYADEEYTHMTVAAAVLTGRASTGLGVQSAANALGLDFVPVGSEEYDLVIPLRYRDDARIQALLSVIRSQNFIDEAMNMGGYGTEKTGAIIWETPGQ